MHSDQPIPQDLGLEKTIISELLLEAESDHENLRLEIVKLKRNDFYSPHHQNIVNSMLEILCKGNKIDIIGLVTALPEEREDIIDIKEISVTSALLEQHIKQLKVVTAQRQAYIEASNFTSDILQSTEPVKDLAEFSGKIGKIINEAIIGNESFKAMSSLGHSMIESGISSGFITHDWNDSGLKEGKVTLLLGTKGQGKTTLSKQMIVAAARQKANCMFFGGEANLEQEKSNLALLVAKDDEVLKKSNIGGRIVNYPSPVAMSRFEDYYSEYINICGTELTNDPEELWNVLLQNMKSHAKNKKGKLYVVDNIMVLNNAPGNKKFTEQKQICQEMKNFTKEYNCHIILIAHPKKGEGYQTTSGVGEQEALVDTIIRYVRITDPEDRAKKLRHVDMPDHEKEKVSAILINEKVRDGGTQKTTLFEYDIKRGAIIELSSLPKATEYQYNGYWVRSLHRIADEDVPTQYKE